MIDAISYFLLQPEPLLLCHQLYMDERLCSWAAPAIRKRRNGVLRLRHMGTGTHAARWARPVNVMDFLSCAQNCQQSQLHGAEFALRERDPASVSLGCEKTVRSLEDRCERQGCKFTAAERLPQAAQTAQPRGRAQREAQPPRASGTGAILKSKSCPK